MYLETFLGNFEGGILGGVRGYSGISGGHLGGVLTLLPLERKSKQKNYAQTLVLVNLILVNLFSFLLSTRNASGRFGPSLDTTKL